MLSAPLLMLSSQPLFLITLTSSVERATLRAVPRGVER